MTELLRQALPASAARLGNVTARMARRLCLAMLCVAASTGHAAVASACGRAPALQLDRITERVILVGETHGTVQAPAFIASLICALASRGPLLLALERSVNEQPALDRFLASGGEVKDVQALIQQRAWASAGQDGRSSAAMLQLIDDMRRLRQGGREVAVRAVVPLWDPDAPSVASDSEPSSEAARFERALADSITAAIADHPGATVVVFAGSFHTAVASRTHQSLAGGPSMGDVLASRRPVHVIGLKADAGAAWICVRQCGVHPMASGAWSESDARVDTTVDLGAVTPSQPAAQQATESAL